MEQGTNMLASYRPVDLSKKNFDRLPTNRAQDRKADPLAVWKRGHRRRVAAWHAEQREAARARLEADRLRRRKAAKEYASGKRDDLVIDYVDAERPLAAFENGAD